MIIERLSKERLSKHGVKEICSYAAGKKTKKEEIYRLIFDEDNHVAWQALWVMTHFNEEDGRYLWSKHDELIDAVLTEQHGGKRRLLLNLLLKQPYTAERLRGDFVDFCLQESMNTKETLGTRALCIKLSFIQCRLYPELLSELNSCMEIIAEEYMTPAVKSSIARVRKELEMRD